MLVCGLIVSIIAIGNATARDTETPVTQQVLGRVETCKLNTSSYCVINHGLGVKPTAVVATPAGPGQNITIDVSKITETSYTVKALWHDGKPFTKQPTITFNAIYTYVGAPVEPSPSPTVTSPTATNPSNPTPTPTATVTPTSTIPADKSCNPTNTIAHFTGEGSDAIGDAPSTEAPGQYNASAEQWAVKDDYSSNMCVYSKDDWYVEIKATDHGDGAVQAYPSMRKIYHDWGLGGDFSKDPKVSSFPQLKATVAHTSPSDCAGCIYEEAFDIWLNGIGGSKPELMIWTHNQDQVPYGNLKATNITLDGVQWDYYNSGTYMAFVPHDKSANLSGKTFDLKQYIAYVSNVVGSDPTLGQISYGVEPVDTDGVFKRWDFTKFEILDK
jgi:hypothetical protein